MYISEMIQTTQSYFKFSNLKWFQNEKNKQAQIFYSFQSLILTPLFAKQFFLSDIVFQSEVCGLNGIFNKKD